ncbi:MAG: AmmeMemoRadiSam system protein A [Acidobacteriota bacterium]|jgi:AmmeMemoRadiSam system protein A|nr:AmmeMemoRadiSam system protein A [Acidobacteriota bacterium]
MKRGYLVPHPPLIVPGVGKGSEIPDTRRAYEQIASEIENVNPETVVIISPHSILYGDYFHIAPGKGAEGDFGEFGAKNIKFSVSYDEEFASLTGDFAREIGLPAGPLGVRKPALDHGVTVPLYFIKTRRIVRISLSGLPAIDHYRLGMCIARAGEQLGRNFVIIASGDMSHKLKGSHYGFAAEGPEFDNLTRGRIERGDMRELVEIDPALCEKAAECGFKSIAMLAGAFDGCKVGTKVLSYEGPFGVGYLTASFEETGRAESLLPELLAARDEKIKAIRSREDEYARLARTSVEHFTLTGKRLKCPGGLSGGLLNDRAGVFVSIKKDGNLRGCIGTTMPTESNIAEEIISNGISAASRDPRFDPVEDSELGGLTYSVDVLSPAEPINGKSELDVNRFGVIVKCGKKSGLLLPALDGVDTVEDQISIALKKAGINQNEPYALERFEVIRHT